VCVITGHGLKDPEIVERLTPSPIVVEPDADAIAAAGQ
jgi:threonine synthase